jgi:hypothetical protein
MYQSSIISITNQTERTFKFPNLFYNLEKLTWARESQIQKEKKHFYSFPKFYSRLVVMPTSFSLCPNLRIIDFLCKLTNIKDLMTANFHK